jgi:hypothetical protein
VLVVYPGTQPQAVTDTPVAASRLAPSRRRQELPLRGSLELTGHRVFVKVRETRLDVAYELRMTTAHDLFSVAQRGGADPFALPRPCSVEGCARARHDHDAVRPTRRCKQRRQQRCKG